MGADCPVKCPSCGYENKQAVICSMCQSPLAKLAKATAEKAAAVVPEKAPAPKAPPKPVEAPAPPPADAAPATAAVCGSCGRKIAAGLSACQFCGGAAAAPKSGEDEPEADVALQLGRIKHRVAAAGQIREMEDRRQHPGRAALEAILFGLGAPVVLPALAVGSLGSSRVARRLTIIGLVVFGLVLTLAAWSVSARWLENRPSWLGAVVPAAVVSWLAALVVAARAWLDGADDRPVSLVPSRRTGVVVVAGAIALAAAGASLPSFSGPGEVEEKTSRPITVDEALATAAAHPRIVQLTASVDWANALWRSDVGQRISWGSGAVAGVAVQDVRELATRGDELVGAWARIEQVDPIATTGAPQVFLKAADGNPFGDHDQRVFALLGEPARRIVAISSSLASSKAEDFTKATTLSGYVRRLGADNAQAKQFAEAFHQALPPETLVFWVAPPPATEQVALYAPVEGSSDRLWVAIPGEKPLPQGAALRGVLRRAAMATESGLVALLKERRPASAADVFAVVSIVPDPEEYVKRLGGADAAARATGSASVWGALALAVVGLGLLGFGAKLATVD
jgi:hypothetical protein